MPRKGTPLTEEHKKKMAEGRARIKAEREAAEQAEAAEREARLAEEGSEADRLAAQRKAFADAEAIRQAEANPPAENMPPAATTAPTYTPSPQTQGVSEWGPYDKYVIVSTPYGEYGVEVGYVMTFEKYTFYDKRSNTNREAHRPVYRHAVTGELRDVHMKMKTAVS